MSELLTQQSLPVQQRSMLLLTTTLSSLFMKNDGTYTSYTGKDAIVTDISASMQRSSSAIPVPVGAGLDPPAVPRPKARNGQDRSLQAATEPPRPRRGGS
jgi:hypothetical protein